MVRKLLLMTAAWWALACAGCAMRPGTGLSSPAGPGTDTPYPFAPAAIEVHPLTRMTRDSANHPLIIGHVECRDAWGDTTKAFGELRVFLIAGVQGESAGGRELRWDVDLTDLEKNAALFDPATRTYRLPLQDVPAWAEGGSGPGERLRLRAVLVTVNAKGREITLEDEYVFP